MVLQIGLPKASWRAFWARLYARRRLLSELAAPFAPMHYALIGEKLGYRPNAFFDPHYFCDHTNVARNSSRGLLALYLARPEANAPSPSAEFDHAWYASQNPDWIRSYPHPFLHFLETGLRNGRRPRPDIDLEFVRDVIRGRCRSLEAAAYRVFDRTPCDEELGPPLNREEFRARQDRFYAAGRLRIEREAGRAARNVLVFVQCGQDFDASYLQEPRAYDVLLNYYKESAVNPKSDIAVFQAGTKTTAIRRLMELRPDLLLRYEAVLFLDDDVEIGAEGIDALFRAMATEKLDLAQPALTADSLTAYPFLKTSSVGDGVMRVLVGRDHGAGDNAACARIRKLGVCGVSQRLGKRLAPGAGGAAGVRTDECRRHRLGRRPARDPGRHRRRRVLRISAPIRRRSRS